MAKVRSVRLLNVCATCHAVRACVQLPWRGRDTAMRNSSIPTPVFYICIRTHALTPAQPMHMHNNAHACCGYMRAHSHLRLLRTPACAIATGIVFPGGVPPGHAAALPPVGQIAPDSFKPQQHAEQRNFSMVREDVGHAAVQAVSRVRGDDVGLCVGTCTLVAL